MAKRKLPDYIDGTIREFRKRKRKEYRAVLHAVGVYSLASAHTPKEAYEDFQKARLILLRVGHSLTKKAWGP